MSSNNIIDLFLNPKSVAVIGASTNPMKGGNWILNNLTMNNFKGKIYPINPNAEGKVVYNLEIKKSVLDVDDEIDLAIFYVPNRLIPGLLAECVQKGIKGAIIEASGFEEVGEPGLKLRDQILKITDNFSKIRLVGPNCMGVTRIDGDSNSDEKGGFFASFGILANYRRGNLAIISQSGMLNGGYLMHLMTMYPDLGIRYSCSIGNKMDIGEIEFLDYLLKDSTVNVIAIYLESFNDPRRFIELCREAKRIPNKTIIFIKGGITKQGQKASLSHTGAISEDGKLTEAIIRQAGVIRVNSFYELFQTARVFSMMYNANKVLPKHGNVAMIVGSGGAGTVSADLTIKYGLNFPILGDKAYKTLVEVFPEWMPPNRFALVDIWPAIEKAKEKVNEMMNLVLKTILDEPKIEGLFNMVFCAKRSMDMDTIDRRIEVSNKSPKPVFYWLIGEHEEVIRISELLSQYHIPSFISLEEMVKTFSLLIQEARSKEKILNIKN
ncbi:MAG: CoA-binding protein [Promethearchaeota archaeon]